MAATSEDLYKIEDPSDRQAQEEAHMAFIIMEAETLINELGFDCVMKLMSKEVQEKIYFTVLLDIEKDKQQQEQTKQQNDPIRDVLNASTTGGY